jgi:hypothetical protein
MMDKTSLRYIYKDYIASVKEEYHCTEKEYKDICYLFNKLISDKMIDEGYKFKLPDNMGSISVSKNKMKYEKLHFDYVEWRKSGIKSYHLNEHSDNYYAFVRWNKVGSTLKNKYFYGFKFTKANRRRVAKVMKTENGHQIYEIATKKDAI